MKLFTSKGSRRLLFSVLACVPLVTAFSYGDNLRQVFNNFSNRNVPLESRTLITHEVPSGDFAAVISAESISKTGDIPIHAWFSPGNMRPGNMDIDWTKNNSFIKSFKTMEDATATRIGGDKAMTALRQKADWTPADRAAWDASTANTIADIAHHTSCFNKYRTDTDHNKKTPRTRHLNELSCDIDNNTFTKEYDCEGMSIVKSVLQQRMADKFLSDSQKTKYFYVNGVGELSLYEDAPGGHAYIVLEKGGMVTGVIEATEDADVYRNLAKPISFADFTNGKNIVTSKGAVYGFEFTHEKADQDRTAVGIKPYKVFMQELKEKRAKQLEQMKQQKAAPSTRS